jgi:methyltransferase (TIGR00027 family)
MQADRPSRTAWGVAQRRAAHQLFDTPPLVLDDPLAVRILGAGAAERILEEQETHQSPFGRAMRSFVVARSRYAEDRLAEAVAAGVRQYVVLGAGLDTSAYRCPHALGDLRIYEVDHPATQGWKRRLLAQADIAVPALVRFAGVDFERDAMLPKLEEAGFDPAQPTCVSWLGVTPYLTLAAFRETVRHIASLPAGTSLTFEYALDRSLLNEQERAGLDALMARVAQVGEPFQLFFTPEQVQAEVLAAGFQKIVAMDPSGINALYFRDRADGLQLLGRSAWLVTAWR